MNETVINIFAALVSGLDYLVETGKSIVRAIKGPPSYWGARFAFSRQRLLERRQRLAAAALRSATPIVAVVK